MKKVIITLLALSLLCSLAFAAGNFQEDLKRLAEVNATNYLQPFSTAFGTNMNAGLYHTAKIHKLLGFDVGFRMMLAMIPDEGKTYNFAMPGEIDIPKNMIYPGQTGFFTISSAGIYPLANLEAPTVFGIDSTRTIEPDDAMLLQTLADSLNITEAELRALLQAAGYSVSAISQQASFPVPPGLNLDYLPLAMPQISVGLPMNTEVMLRFFPKTEISKDIGEFAFLGIGVKHSLSQYIPMFPVDISAQFVYQSLEVGDIITSTHTCFNVHASKKFLIFTPYIGLGFESSNFKVDYTIEGTGNPLLDGQEVSFDLEGENGFRARAGFSLSFFPLLKLTADYAIGDYNVATAGLMLTLR